MSTIFDSIVTKENDHTNLLRNVMERHPKLAAAVLSYLIERPVLPEDTASYNFSTQSPSSGIGGREIPDIRVYGRDFHCIIEAKIDPGLQLTEVQKRGYQACFPRTGDRHLSFLVPNEWKHFRSIEQIRAVLPSTISIHIANWQEIVRRLENVPEYPKDAILEEAINFWKWQFQGKPMTQTEIDSLNQWSGEMYSAIRKLEKTLTRARRLFDARSINIVTEPETSYTDGYGFYLKRGGSYILWVGIWTTTPNPLSFGFDTIAGNWLRPKVLPLPRSTAHNHYLWPLESETWDDPEQLYTTVNLFLQSYLVQCD